MKCMSCYETTDFDFCLNCRKRLFDKKRVSSRLEFEIPSAHENATGEENKDANRAEMQHIALFLNRNKLERVDDSNEKSFTFYNALYDLKHIESVSQFKYSNEMPENEHLTMQIAEQVFGIQTTANTLILTSDDVPAILYRRFDFANNERLYAENFVQLSQRVKQLMGADFHFDGNYEEIAKMIRKYVSAYLPALEELFKRIIFNYLFSVTHLSFKDFSIIKMSTGECKLAPAYNLFNMQLHVDPLVESNLKMYKDVHTSSQLNMHSYLRQAHFLEFASRIGIMKKRALKILNLFPSSESKVIELVQLSFLQHATQQQFIEIFKRKLQHLQD